MTCFCLLGHEAKNVIFCTLTASGDEAQFELGEFVSEQNCQIWEVEYSREICMHRNLQCVLSGLVKLSRCMEMLLL